MFGGPGVDLRGEAAQEIFALASGVLAWFHAREPVRVRSLAVDLVKGRVIATIEEAPRPRVVRIDRSNDPGSTAELLDLATPLVARLSELSRAQLERRRLTLTR